MDSVRLPAKKSEQKLNISTKFVYLITFVWSWLEMSEYLNQSNVTGIGKMYIFPSLSHHLILTILSIMVSVSTIYIDFR